MNQNGRNDEKSDQEKRRNGAKETMARSGKEIFRVVSVGRTRVAVGWEGDEWGEMGF